VHSLSPERGRGRTAALGNSSFATRGSWDKKGRKGRKGGTSRKKKERCHPPVAPRTRHYSNQGKEGGGRPYPAKRGKGRVRAPHCIELEGGDVFVLKRRRKKKKREKGGKRLPSREKERRRKTIGDSWSRPFQALPCKHGASCGITQREGEKEGEGKVLQPPQKKKEKEGRPIHNYAKKRIIKDEEPSVHEQKGEKKGDSVHIYVQERGGEVVRSRSRRSRKGKDGCKLKRGGRERRKP